MKKIKKMTKKAILESLEAHNININLYVEAKHTEPVREPGAIGICETKKGNLMVYMVNDKGQMYNTSVHTNRREANGRVFQRIMAAYAMV